MPSQVSRTQGGIFKNQRLLIYYYRKPVNITFEKLEGVHFYIFAEKIT